MKNDIDSILDALFSGGKLNVGSGTKSRAAKDAEEFLNSIEKTNANMQSSLNRQISDLDKLTSDAQRSMDEMRRLLDAEKVPYVINHRLVRGLHRPLVAAGAMVRPRPVGTLWCAAAGRCVGGAGGHWPDKFV